MPRLSPVIHTITLLLAILASYLWLQTPFLVGYSLQAFSATILIYFLIKRLNKSRLHHIAPSPNSLEMPLMTFALLLLIGSTGNFNSLLFPLTYLHLFFLVLGTQNITAIATTFGIILFHLNLTPYMTTTNWSTVLTIPIILILFLFTKRQQSDLIKTKIERERADKAKELLKTYNAEQSRELEKVNRIKEVEEAELLTLESFLQSFLKPKLEYMNEVAQKSESHLVIKSQVEVLCQRVDELLNQSKS